MTGARLAGKIAIVTGAGSAGPGWGNGRAVAVRFAEEGAAIRDHEEIYEIGAFFDPTRSTRIGTSGSLYDDTYADGQAAKNYSLLVSGWLFY